MGLRGTLQQFTVIVEEFAPGDPDHQHVRIGLISPSANVFRGLGELVRHANRGEDLEAKLLGRLGRDYDELSARIVAWLDFLDR